MDLGRLWGGRVRAGGVCHRLIRSSGTQTISSGPLGGPTQHTSLSAAVWMLQGLYRLCTVIFLGPEESLGDIAQSPAWQVQDTLRYMPHPKSHSESPVYT